MTSLEDAKAEDIVGIDLIGRTTLADVMIVATGRSSTHVGAIADRVVKACRDNGFRPPRIEGQPVNDWVLIDAGRRHRAYLPARKFASSTISRRCGRPSGRPSRMRSAIEP